MDFGIYEGAVKSQDGGVNFSEKTFETISAEIDALDDDLRQLNLDIHDHPELMFEEYYAHDTLTSFMASHSHEWVVKQRQFGLETAWSATFTHGTGGRTLGVNSEMDALPAIGHACGHNLIATAGVAVALAVKAAMIKHDIPGKVVLLGTPAEEGGAGKVFMLNAGAYDSMDACIMCHPSPGRKNETGIRSSLANQHFKVTYTGHTAHAAAAPWEGKNAMDAAILAYTNVSLLRQQIHPSHRVHGVFEGENLAVNIIPDKVNMHWLIRAPTSEGVQDTASRVKACFEAAAIATGCKADIAEAGFPMNETRQNRVLGAEFARTWRANFGNCVEAYDETMFASTDFGNVTHALPALHPGYSIPSVPNGGNHTALFAYAAGTPEAHKATLEVAKALAVTGLRLLSDDSFFTEVKAAYEADKTRDLSDIWSES